MKRLFLFLIFLLTACSSGTPSSLPSFDWALRPTPEAHMWRIRLGHSVTSAVTQTILASSAQVTAAGLTITLDEWGGNKTAQWTGITGGAADRARVWIDVQEAGGWTTVFSGSLVSRPTLAAGQREAVGDKYLRFKEIPVVQTGVDTAQNVSADQVRWGANPTGAAPLSLSADTLREAVRKLLAADALADLPHLIVTPAALPNGGPAVKRVFNGESLASALDGLMAQQPDWGWTTLPDDSVYVGPRPSGIATANAALSGVRVALRDVNSEGLRNAVLWRLNLPGGRSVAYESRHATTATLGRSSLTRYIDARSREAVTRTVATTYTIVYGDGTEQTVTDVGMLATLRDGVAASGEIVQGVAMRATLGASADWAEVVVSTLNGPEAEVSVSGVVGLNPAIHWVSRLPANARTVLYLPLLTAGATITINSRVSGGWWTVQELNPRALNHATLDAAAQELYRIPAQHAGTVSVPGRQVPVGSVTVQRPGEPDFTERCVGTRYLIREPIRTEYVLGEPDDPVDDQVLRVLIERRDEEATAQAVNTPGSA